MNASALSPPVQPPAGPDDATARWRLAARVAGVYLALALLSLGLARGSGTVASLWFANAAAVAVLVSRPVAWWPTLLAAALAADTAATLVWGDSLALSAELAVFNLVEMLTAAALLTLTGAHRRMMFEPGRLFRVLVFGAFIPSLAGATVSALTLSLPLPSAFWRAWLGWYEGAALGACAMLPLALTVVTTPWPVLRRQMLAPEAIAFILVAVAVAAFAWLRLPYPFVYVSLALVLGAVYARFLVVSAMVAIVAAMAGVLLARGVLPLAGGTFDVVDQALVDLPLFAAIVPPLLLSVAMERARHARERVSLALSTGSGALRHTLTVEGRLVEVDDAWLTALGYEEADVLGRPLADFTAGDATSLDVLWQQLEREGHCSEVPMQWVTRAGTPRDVLFSAMVENRLFGRRVVAAAEDITERRRLERDLAAEHECLRVTLHSIGDGVITTDREGRVQYLNPVAEDLTGWPCDEAIGRPFDEVFRMVDRQTGAPLESPIARVLGDGRPAGLPEHVLLVGRGGRQSAIEDSASPIRDRDGAVLGVVMVFHDVTAARVMADRMAHMAQHDALTDLPNRVLLNDRLSQAVLAAQRAGSRFAVMFIDLDHFKQINDTLGHGAGDQLLRIVAGRLGGLLREVDTVSRLGGDEFVLLLSGIETPGDAAEVAAKILRTVAQPCEVAGQTLAVSSSVGIALYPEDGDSGDALIRASDAAMYRAKQAGRNQFRFHRDTLSPAAGPATAMPEIAGSGAANPYPGRDQVQGQGPFTPRR